MRKPNSVSYVEAQFAPDYCRYLYLQMLKEIRQGIDICLPKWKKDVLLILLEKSRTHPLNKKLLRKEVTGAVGKATDVVFRRMEG